jgi:hypothetical protein
MIGVSVDAIELEALANTITSSMMTWLPLIFRANRMNPGDHHVELFDVQHATAIVGSLRIQCAEDLLYSTNGMKPTVAQMTTRRMTDQLHAVIDEAPVVL